jgi:hypothetical protein
MRCISGAQGLDSDWNRVSGSLPCPVCGGDDECRTHAEEAFACCLRQPSDWRLSNGGWLHRIGSFEAKLSVGSSRRSAERRPADAPASVNS